MNPFKSSGPRYSRRTALQQIGGGFGALALAQLFAGELIAQEPTTEITNLNGGLHHPAKVKRIIQLFMNGGVSQMDTFDYKPELDRRHGEKMDFGIKSAATSVPGPLMKSPFTWQQHGESGRWVTDVFPAMAEHVDEMAFLMAMQSRTNVHGPASYLQTTGFLFPGFPCCGSWVSYALGRLTDDLPTFVVLPDPRGLPYNGMGNFSSGFLPAVHQGTVVQPTPNAPAHIRDLQPDGGARFISDGASQQGLELLRQMNVQYADNHPGDSRLDARIHAYELAARMQLSAPEAFDLSRETAETHKAYGLDAPTEEVGFARNCLLARRLIERGVRFVQVWSGAGGPKNNWDNHANIQTELPAIARQVDRPIAALLHDLKSTGLWEDTLVIWTTEFGRMPFTQDSTGRDHNGGTFVTWLAGASVRAGCSHGESDDFGFAAARDATTGYDLHATMLHLLGVDHKRLTVRHNGIDRRLTDVHGEVIKRILS